MRYSTQLPVKGGQRLAVPVSVEPRRIDGAWIAQEYIKGHFGAKNPVVIRKGHIAVPQRPSLGVKPEPGMFGKPVAIYGP